MERVRIGEQPETSKIIRNRITYLPVAKPIWKIQELLVVDTESTNFKLFITLAQRLGLETNDEPLRLLNWQLASNF